jgi:hypothetical protein
MNAISKPALAIPPKVSRRGTMIDPAHVTASDAFKVRQGGIDQNHVRNLSAALLNDRECLPPIALWAETRGGKLTGKCILLDGWHRLAAYKAASRMPSVGHMKVKVHVYTCSQVEAKMIALTANAKDTLNLSYSEKADAAWELVRTPEGAPSVARIAGAAAISKRSVANMRKRWKEMKEAGAEPTGEWWRDRQDAPEEGFEGKPEETPAEVKADNIRRANLIRETLEGLINRDHARIGDVLNIALGLHFKAIAEYHFGDDFLDGPTGTDTGTAEGDAGDF